MIHRVVIVTQATVSIGWQSADYRSNIAGRVEFFINESSYCECLLMGTGGNKKHSVNSFGGSLAYRLKNFIIDFGAKPVVSLVILPEKIFFNNGFTQKNIPYISVPNLKHPLDEDEMHFFISGFLKTLDKIKKESANA